MQSIEVTSRNSFQFWRQALARCQLRSKHVPLVAALLILVLPLLLQSAVPMVYAERHGWNNHHSQNQVSIDSHSLSGDKTTLVIKVSVTIRDNNHDCRDNRCGNDRERNERKQVKFTLTVSYGDHQLDPKNDGTRFFRESKTAELTKRSDGTWYAEATFNVPCKGYYYYLYELDARYDGRYNTWIGSDWVDPREGVAPE